MDWRQASTLAASNLSSLHARVDRAIWSCAVTAAWWMMRDAPSSAALRTRASSVTMACEALGATAGTGSCPGVGSSSEAAIGPRMDGVELR
jgi:hypothetical protein